MKCSNCSNIITSCRDCIFCGNKFCCFICLEAHYLSAHKNKKIDSSKSKDKKMSQISKNKDNDKIKISPYLVSGIISKKIHYDSKYNLDNFTPVMDGKEIKSIGSGSFGQVYLALNTLDNKIYAIKHMDKKKLIKILHSLKGIYQEIDIQSRIDHPNIVKILYTDEDEDSFDLVMEYAESGSLFHYIRKNKGLNEFKTFQLFIQVVNAINFLHENDLIHRDIKPENILLFKNMNKTKGNTTEFTVKLCDFGWCVKLNGEERGTFCGTTEYMSPELVNHKDYSKEIDVWSLGILLYEMIHGYSPFRPNKSKFEEKDVFDNIKKHKLKFGKKVSEECRKLIYRLLAFNKNRRYKVEDIYNSKFVKYFEKINYCIPKKVNENINIQNDDEDEEDMEQIHQIKTNNNNFIYREINEVEENEDFNINKNPIYEVYNELQQLNQQNLRKAFTNNSNSIDKKLIKSLPKNNTKENKYAGFRNKYNLSLVNTKTDKNKSISFNNNVNKLNQSMNKKRLSNKSANDLIDKYKAKKNYSLHKEYKDNHKTLNSINENVLKKNRTISKEYMRSFSKDSKLYFSKKLSNNHHNDNKQIYYSYISNKKDKNNITKESYNKKNLTNSNINKEKNNKNKVNQIIINKYEIANKKKSISKSNNNQKLKKEGNIHNNLHPIETTGKIPLNTDKYINKKSNDYLSSNNYLSNKNISQRLKTNINININTSNNSISTKIKRENQLSLNEKKKNYNLLKNKTLNKNKSNNKKNIIIKNDYTDVNNQKYNNSKIGLKKVQSTRCNIKKINNHKQVDIYKDSNSNFYDTSNIENTNLDTIKSGYSPENIINQKINTVGGIEVINSRANYNNRKSPDLKYYYHNPKILLSNSKLNNKGRSPYDRKNKENKKSILKLNNFSNNGMKALHKKKVSSISPKHVKNINSFKNDNSSKYNSNSFSCKLNKNGKRKINSVSNKNYRTKMNHIEFYSSSLSNEKLLNNNNNANISHTNIINKKNINIYGINKNLFNESNNDHSRIQSERVISNNQSNKKNISTPPTGNFIFIKSQRYEGNKRKEKLYTQNKNKSPEQHQQLIRKNSTQEKKRISPQQNVNSKNISHQKGITNIKLQNKKSFCFVSRNNNKSPVNANKYENIYCGPINKINNINYQSNNINNFYIINNNNNNNMNNSGINQRSLKKQFTEQQRELKKNIDYSMLPISIIENGCINSTYNNKNKDKKTIKDSNKKKSFSKNKDKYSLKHYFMKIKSKRVHSYNNKRYIKAKEKSKESESNIIYVDSEFSDEAEKNITPKKNKDCMKINPMKLLGDFKEGRTIFHKHNKNLSQYSETNG